MTLVQKANAANGYQDTINLNEAIATQTVNDDRSLTYASTIEGGLIYTRVFPAGTCFIQSVASSNGAVVVEEYGRIGGRTASGSQPRPTIPDQGRPIVDPPGSTQKPQVVPPSPEEPNPTPTPGITRPAPVE